MFPFCVGTTPRRVRKLNEKASETGKTGRQAVPRTLRHRPGLTWAPPPPAASLGVGAGDLWRYIHRLDFT